MGDNWGVVLDCGSSGTRAHIFRWQDPSATVSEFFPPTKDDEDLLKLSPGISSFAAHPAGVRAYIAPLLQHVERWVPRERRASTQLRAFATAGMRLLTSAQQEAIWGELRSAFAATPFAFKAVDAVTISGNFEGLFGWLAAREVFGPGEAHFGMLDLGGASTQIAVAPPSSMILEDAYRVRWQGEEMRVYSHSYMRSGMDQAAIDRALGRVVIDDYKATLAAAPLPWPT